MTTTATRPVTDQEAFILDYLRRLEYGNLVIEVQRGVPVRIVRYEESVKVPQPPVAPPPPDTPRWTI